MPPTDTREFKQLPIGLLDLPQLDARMDRNPEELELLAGDIARRGVILPLVVVRTGERFEIVDGTCRLLASRRAGLVTVPCLIYEQRDEALDGVKYAANIFRLEMTPAEEATYFQHLYYHRCDEDIDRVCDLVGQKRSYVDSRLQLAMGDDEVFEAVRAKKVTLGVAAKLNEIPDEGWRRFYLTHAMKGGATVSVVTGWVMDWKNTHGAEHQAPADAVTSSAPTIVSSYDPHRCYICDESDPRFIPEQVSVHTHCRLAVLDKMIAAYRGSGTPTT